MAVEDTSLSALAGRQNSLSSLDDDTSLSLLAAETRARVVQRPGAKASPAKRRAADSSSSDDSTSSDSSDDEDFPLTKRLKGAAKVDRPIHPSIGNIKDLKVGDNVLARQSDGSWKGATISRVRRTTVIVDWNDGTNHHKMKRLKDLRKYQVGDRVEARYSNGRWYPAVVAQVRKKTIIVTWEDHYDANRRKNYNQVRPAPEEVPDMAPEPEGNRECVICREAKPLSQFQGNITEACRHVRDVCHRCARRTIGMELNGKGNLNMLCPHVGCGGRLSHADIKREAGDELFERYDALLTRKALEEMPNFRWCAHSGCGNGQEVVMPGEDSRGVWMTCQECRHRTCVYHRCEWHAERTCEQYDQDARRADEVALLQYFEREEVHRCPRCQQAIEKNDGCDRMTCRPPGGCGHEFCWRCLASYQGPRGISLRGNSAHHRSCRYYRPNPESADEGEEDDEGEGEEEEEGDEEESTDESEESESDI